MEVAARTSDRRALCASAIVLAVALKIAWHLLDPHPYFLLGDSAVYLEEARTLHPGLARPLGYPVFLRSFLGIFRDIRAVTFLQACLALLASFVLFRAVRARFRSAFAAVGTFVLLVLWPWSAFYEKTILAESVTLLPLALSFLLLIGSRRPEACFLSGVCLGLGALVRPVLLSVVPVGLLWILGKERREDPARLLRLGGALLAGLLILTAPYAAGIRVLSGAWGIAHFDGWTLFGLTGGHLEVENIRDPEVREVFLSWPSDPADLSPAERMWSEKSPVKGLLRHYKEKSGGSDAFAAEMKEHLAHRRWGSAARRAFSREPTEWVRTNQALRKTARDTVLDHPGAYLAAVLQGISVFFVRGGEHRRYFQSPETAEHPFAVADARSLGSLERSLRAWNSKWEWPRNAGGGGDPARVLRLPISVRSPLSSARGFGVHGTKASPKRGVPSRPPLRLGTLVRHVGGQRRL
ncbi:MAG: glycosyltransferase family 39 protein [Candidatus Eisenbacteria bacterium]|nr:glycosyltransferase family 39 protein [Candidatus Eisenbacteria bacterium]